jgi:acyl transferase domain-containing protein
MSEAEFMDPSIRLALEVAHQVHLPTSRIIFPSLNSLIQALIDSGIDYKGSYTGVYYAQLLTSTGELVDDRYDIGNYHGLGKCIALRANRVSFTFDLRGPSLVVDTGRQMRNSLALWISFNYLLSMLVCRHRDASCLICH